MGHTGIVPPPPWQPPTDLAATDTENCDYHFIKFSGEYLADGSERQDLIVALRNMPETELILETWSLRDIYVLLRVPEGKERETEEWINRIAKQRIYERVGLGWVRVAGELIRFAK